MAKKKHENPGMAWVRREMKRIEKGIPARSRTVGQLLDLYDAIQSEISKLSVRMRNVRLEIYPEDPPKGYQFNRWDTGVKVACVVPDRLHQGLLLYNFGYATHEGKVYQSWHTDWFEGFDDLKLYEQAHPKATSSQGAGDLEDLAWLGNVERLAWFGGGNLVYLQYSEERAKLGLAYYYLEQRDRQVRQRCWPAIKELEKIVQETFRAQYGDRVFYSNPKNDASVRVFLGDRFIATYEKGRLLMFDTYSEVQVPLSAALKRDSPYDIKTNHDLRQHLRELRERKERNK